MAFFDELKRNLSGVSETVAKTSGTVMKKSEHVLEIQKAKLKKASLESEMKDIYAKLGKLYFEHYADGDMPKEMAALCEKVAACQHAIDEASQRVADLRGVVICSNCQAEVDKEAAYCPKCGSEIVHVVEDMTAENVEEQDSDIQEDAENEFGMEPEDAPADGEAQEPEDVPEDAASEPEADETKPSQVEKGPETASE